MLSHTAIVVPLLPSMTLLPTILTKICCILISRSLTELTDYVHNLAVQEPKTNVYSW